MSGAVKAFAYAMLHTRISLNTPKTSCYSVRSVSTVDMYGSRGGRGGRGPNSHHRGRGGGGRGRGGGGGGERGRGGVGGGARGGGEQRWWDPAWRKQRLEQMRVEVEKLDENEWWRKMEELKDKDQQEIVIKSNYGREGAAILEDMAFQMGLHFHAYNKGRNTVLVVSKVPLPNYRADLDEKHGSTHRQINLSAATENRVEKMLAKAKADDSSSSKIARVVTYGATGVSTIFEEPLSVIGTDLDMEKLNLELHNKQIRLMANPAIKSMLSFREKLPAYKMKSDILRAIKENQVVVVTGETGCGKTTQLPQLILEESIELLKGAQCNIICTQPRRVSAISVAARVSAERGEQLGETIGYQIRMESKRSRETRLLYCTTGVLLRRLVQDPDLKGVSHVIVDEIHERGINEDFLIIVLRDLLQKRSDLRVILMSATINADLFSQYFDNAPMINIPGFTFDVRELYLEDVLETTRHRIISDSRTSHFDSRKRGKQMDQKKDSMVQLFEDININLHYGKYSSQTRRSLEAWDGSRIDFGLIQSLIMHICSYEGDGAILVFLTGWDDISKLLDILRENNILSDRKHFLLLPLHGSMPTVNQQEIFQRPPNGIRKIILATNIAETSITIDDVVFVIDCGKAKETSYDALNKLACLTPSWISKASARQRRGRAGRVQPGVCYRLYPKVIYDAMPEYQLPEMLRTPLQELCLQIKSLHLGKVSDFLSKALQPPEPLAVENALELLKTIGALDENEDLTSLGCHLSVLPLDPKVGKMLLMGAVFQCLEPALIIAAALAYRDPFVLPIDKKEEADDAKRSFAGDSLSDHICLLRAFKSWKAAQYNGQDVRRFCYQNFLSMSTLQLMDDMQKQFRDLLCDIGFIDKQLRLEAYNRYSGNFEMVSAILCAGLFPNVVQCKQRGKRSAFFTKEDGKVDIHPASVNSRVASFPLPYLVYSNKVKTTSIFIRDSTNISDHALLMFGGSFTAGQNDGISMLGDYLHFSASKKTLQLVQTLRSELDNLLQRKIREPSLDITHSGIDIVSAVLEFLHNKIEQ